MLTRTISYKGFLNIPFTDGRFLISSDGVMLDSHNGNIDRPKGNDHVVFDSDSLGVKRSVLVAIAWKGSLLQRRYWNKLETTHIDGDVENVSSENLIWKYPKDGLCDMDNPGYSFVPGFSRYSINKDGQVYSHATKKKLSPYRDEMGYWMYGCQPDVGKRTIIGMHRLLALAYIPFDKNVDRLDVNHRDGKKHNNCLSNLEWGSRKHNCDHAYSTGLRTDNIEVVVRDIFTGEIKEYYSLEDCARQIGCDGETIRLRITSRGQAAFLPGLQFKRKDDPAIWLEFDDPKKALQRSGLRRPLTIENVQTGEQKTFQSFAQCSQFLGLGRTTLSWRLSNHPEESINGYMVKLT